jgi:hypothetical protein
MGDARVVEHSNRKGRKDRRELEYGVASTIFAFFAFFAVNI